MSGLFSYIEIIEQFKSLGGAVVVTVFFGFLLTKQVHEVVRRPSYVMAMLMLFCAIRTPSLAMRAVISEAVSRGEDLPDFDFFIAYQVLSGVGIFALLYAVYTLALDREILTGVGRSHHPFNRITGNRMLFWVIAIPAIVLGTVGPCLGVITDADRFSALRQASTVIFLVLTILVAYRAFLSAQAQFSSGYQYAGESPKAGAIFMCIFAILLLLRGCYAVATMTDLVKQNNEHLLYPLLIVPEMFITFFLTPGRFIPPPYELPD